MKNRILNRVFGQKTIDMNWCFWPRTTSLFICEIYSQLGQLSGQIWILKR